MAHPLTLAGESSGSYMERLRRGLDGAMRHPNFHEIMHLMCSDWVGRFKGGAYGEGGTCSGSVSGSVSVSKVRTPATNHSSSARLRGAALFA